ncbi:hypothetical protein IV102_07430 [bacterium]|nr:hypothetical protein [bacterium]
MYQTSQSVEPLQAPQAQPEKAIVCRDCGHEITRHRSAIEVGGAHEHTFRNPGGYSFHVLCFGEAPGCLNAGQPSQEATWFAGYAWSFALCAACHGHLGWCYRGPGEPVQFAGLIATRLVR